MRRTTVEQLRLVLGAHGFVLGTCAHQTAGMMGAKEHESWQFHPRGRGRGEPVFVVHLRPGRHGTDAHGFAFPGPDAGGTAWAGRFDSLSQAADFARAHGRKAVAV